MLAIDDDNKLQYWKLPNVKTNERSENKEISHQPTNITETSHSAKSDTHNQIRNDTNNNTILPKESVR